MPKRVRRNPHFASDDRGVMQVMEAILAALVLFGAILFVTLTSSPVRDTGAPGVNLATLAEDSLDILQRQDGQDDPTVDRLEEIVNLAMRGDVDQAELFLQDIVPQGTRYALRLDNGIAPLQLVPTAGAALTTPRDASGAATYMLSNWTRFEGTGPDCDLAPERCFVPGAAEAIDGTTAVDFSNWTLYAPSAASGSDTTGPGGLDWIDIWTANQPGQDVIPPNAPYGAWKCDGCTGSSIRIVPPDETAVERQAYAVQLLLWGGT